MEISLMLCHLATPVPNWKFLLGVKELPLPIKHCCLWKYSLPPPSFPLSVWITLCFWFAILSLYTFLKWGCALAIGPKLHLFLLVYLYVKNSVINNLFFQFISLWENGGGDLICCAQASSTRQGDAQRGCIPDHRRWAHVGWQLLPQPCFICNQWMEPDCHKHILVLPP